MSPSTQQLAAFHDALPAWFKPIARDMPWRRTKDPYAIWISEIMLQQTRVDQATPYYLRFTKAFPTIQALASASIDDVLKKWEGLGYYSRARNLHKAAQHIVSTHGGQFPDAYDAVIALPGIGPYTAAAVLSIAFNQPYAVLDGNVIRVLTRIFGIADDVTKGRTKKALQALADQLVHQEHPGMHNEAIMELGATTCTPKNPRCFICPMHTVCVAHDQGKAESYPVKTKKPPTPHYDIAVGLLFNKNDELFIQRRSEEGMLGGLWEFPGGKHEEGETLAQTCHRELQEELGIQVDVGPLFHKVNHAYSHFKITMHAFTCHLKAGTPLSTSGLPTAWVAVDDLHTYAFPRANRHLIAKLLERKTNPTLFD